MCWQEGNRSLPHPPEGGPGNIPRRHPQHKRAGQNKLTLRPSLPDASENHPKELAIAGIAESIGVALPMMTDTASRL